MEALRISMTLLGAVAILAALAGAFNVAGVAEVPVMNSRTIRVLMFCFGSLFLLIGLLGLFGFENGSDDERTPTPDPSATTPTPSTDDGGQQGSPDASSYTQEANAECRGHDGALASLGAPSEEWSDDQFVQYVFARSDLTNRLADALATITPPDAARDDHDSAVFWLVQVADSFSSAGVALRAGDEIGWDQGLDNAESYAADFNRIAQQTLGLSDCGL